MTTYTTIPGTAVDVDSPIDQALMTALRDNPIAIAEGATGAPRILLGALQRLTAGTAIRAKESQILSTVDTGYTEIFSLGLMQKGDVRVELLHRISNGAHSSDVRVRRFRENVATDMATFTTSSTSYVTKTVDFAVLPGDRISVQHKTSNAVATAFINNVYVMTGGEDIFPGAANNVVGFTMNA